MANKKINQLVAKTTIQSTDLFPIGDATTGTLYKKTIADLQAAIGGAVISVNGLVGTVVLDADDILETATPTNRYFTEARARAAISLTTSGSSGASTYSSSTGVLNVPTYTLAGLGGITATFLSGGTGITYNSTTGVISYSGTVYTDSSVRALFSGGTGITYNSSTGAISYSGTVYTDSSIRALFSAGTGLSYNSTTGVFSYSGTVYTDASIRALFSGTSPITYNSTTGAIGISTGNLTESTSSVLTITGGTGALISSASIQVKQASGSQSGFLSSTDWTTFNNKQNTITLTTTGTSGASTFSGGTLNIPQYQAALTNPVTGTSTSGYVTFFNGSTTVSGDSAHFWDNTNKRLGIGTSTPSYPLHVYSTGASSARINLEGTTNFVTNQFTNTSGSFYLGIDDSAGANFTGTAYGRFLYSAGGYPMIFITNAVERMRITSGGNVGIGSTTASGFTRTLKISTASGTAGILLADGDTDRAGFYIDAGTTAPAYIFTNDSKPLVLSVAGAERMRITSGGSVGINGAPEPDSGDTRLQINGSTYSSLNLKSTNVNANIRAHNINGGFYLGTITNHFIAFFANDTERLRVTSGGNILLGTTTDNGERLYVSGAIRATGTITANSDITLKKNLAKIENALDKVEQINGYTYEFKADDSKRHAGVIAQEIQGVLPEIVNKGNDGLLGVEYGNISALLIEAIKDLKSKNELLEARLVALEK